MDYRVYSRKLSLIFIALASIIFASMAVLVRSLTKDYSGATVALARFILTIPMGLIIMAFQGTREVFRIRKPGIWLLRGATGAAALILYYIANGRIGSGESTLLLNTFPIWVVVFGLLFFKEKLRWLEVLAIVLCFIGSLLIFGIGDQWQILGAALALAAGCLRGIAVLLIKQSGRKNHPVMVYLAVCFCGLVLLPFCWRDLALFFNWRNFILIFTVSFLSLIGQIFLGMGMRGLNSALTSIIIYGGIPLTLLLGFAAGERLAYLSWAGAALIVAALFLTLLIKEKKSVDPKADNQP